LSDGELTPAEFAHLRARLLDLYTFVTVLMLLGIAVQAGYILFFVGPLTSPGAQESFGLALALGFLMATVVVHLVDRMYRLWPLGRNVRAERPTILTDRDAVRALRWVVVLGAIGGGAYLIALLLV
jgi:hypothetical protein